MKYGLDEKLRATYGKHLLKLKELRNTVKVKKSINYEK